MKNKTFTIWILAAALFSAVTASAAPTVVTYGGNMLVDEEPFTGTGYFKVALVTDAGETLWSNDGTSHQGSEPAGDFEVEIDEGAYTILLGGEDMLALDPAMFPEEEAVYLRVWFNDGESGFSQFTPDISITSSIYALNAGTLNGFTAADFVHRTEQITADQIASEAVGTSQIEDRSVTAAKISSFSDQGRTFRLGNSSDQTVALVADLGTASSPAIRFNTASDQWELSQNGISYSPIQTSSATGPIEVEGVTISTAELSYLDGLSSNIQSQLNALGAGDISGIAAGNGLAGGASSGEATLNVGAGSGISVGADSIALGALSADWIQTGAFDLALSHADSELKIMESSGGTYYGIVDVDDLTGDRIYLLPDEDGTVALTSSDITGNAATATLAGALSANGANCAAGQFPLGVSASGAAESCSTDISGNAATATAATALAANGANCPAGQYPLGVNASGAAENCSADVSGNAATATLAGALSANGANCAAGQFPLGVDAAGAAEGCSANISGNAATATAALSAATASALAANGANCAAGQYAAGVDAAGAAESCTADDDAPDSDSEVPDQLTLTLISGTNSVIDFSNFDVSGSGAVTINNGTAITGHLSASAALDFPNIAASTCDELTIAVAGAAAGDTVSLGAPASIEDSLIWSGYVSAANTVTVRVCNLTPLFGVNPASATWRADVWKH